MGDHNEGHTPTERNNEENQIEEREPVKLIPEGFVADDTQPSMCLEDFEDDNEVYLIDVPITVDPHKLFGHQLDFRHDISFIIDEQSNERCVSMPSKEPCSAICLFSSRYENAKTMVALNPMGKIDINVSYDVPELGSMIPESTSVQLPVGLKVRHPFLGPKYKEVVKAMEDIQDNIVKRNNCSSPINHAEQSKKNLTVNERVPSDLGPVEEGESLNVVTVKDEVLSPKKSKKRKRESLYEGGNNEDVENSGVDLSPLTKKHKKDKKEEINIQGFPDKGISDEMIVKSTEEGISVIKCKKEKKRRSEIISEVSTATFLGEVGPPIVSSQSPKKKIKKEKKEAQWNADGEGVLDISLAESPKKAKKKKKRDSGFVGESGELDVLPQDVVVLGEVPGRILEGGNEGKKEIVVGQHDRVLNMTSKEEGDSVLGRGIRESKTKKEKSKKRHTIDSIAGLDSNLMAETKMEESAEKELKSEGIEVLNEGSDHPEMKKKRKKDKKRESEIVNMESGMETLKEEVGVIPDTEGQTPKKKKKKIKDEVGADVSSVEPPVVYEVVEETPPKSKKKKKRESEYGVGSGHSDVLSDVTMLEEMPCQILENVKKTKKEVKRESGQTILEVSFEGEGGAEVKKSKKVSMVEAVHLGSQGQCLVPGRKGTEEMEAFPEVVEVFSEEGDHMKKRRKKEKKRESEIVNSESVVESLKEEEVIIPGTPGQTPRKKKKKIKVERECGFKEEVEVDTPLVEPSIPIEVVEETPKKAKKKKKRDSEYGVGSGQDAGFSEDIVLVEEMTGQTPKVEGKSKKEKWYIDPNPSILEPYHGVTNLPDGNKKKKVHVETTLGVQNDGEDSGVNNVFNSDSKKWKRRHTMDSKAVSVVSSDPNRSLWLPEVSTEGKSHHKKRQSLMTQGYEGQLLSPKKEKKIKKESIG